MNGEAFCLHAPKMVRPKISRFRNAESERGVDRSQTPKPAASMPRALLSEQPLTFCRIHRCVTHLGLPQNETPREEGTPTRQRVLTLPVKSRLPPPLDDRPVVRNKRLRQTNPKTRSPSVPVTPSPPPSSVAKTACPRSRPHSLRALLEHSSLVSLQLPPATDTSRHPRPSEAQASAQTPVGLREPLGLTSRPSNAFLVPHLPTWQSRD